MRVDHCDWPTARQKLDEMDKFNDRWHSLVSLPYRLGLLFGFSAAASSLPLVFHKPTAMWFNDTFVHEVGAKGEGGRRWSVQCVGGRGVRVGRGGGDAR